MYSGLIGLIYGIIFNTNHESTDKMERTKYKIPDQYINKEDRPS